MVAYAKSRGDRATQFELRRRVADFAGGPALMWTSQDFAAGRHETQILFALVDADEDGMISPSEREDIEAVLKGCDLNSDGRIELVELHSRLKPRSARRKSNAIEIDWRPWDANQSEHVEDLSVIVSFNEANGKSNLLLDDWALGEPWANSTAELIRANEKEPCGQALLTSHPKITIALTAASEDGTVNSDQVAIGVMAEGNALFRHFDRDGNWSLTMTEILTSCDQLSELDQNADENIDVSELPILLRVCVARGTVVHRSLKEHVSFIQSSDDASDSRPKLTPPEWFVSMDKDGDRMLSRKEFLGGREAFDNLDGDENELLSAEEALSLQPE